MRPVRVLLVEDNESDIYLIRRALSEADFPHVLTVLSDGAEARAFLERKGVTTEDPLPEIVLPENPLPEIVLLDMNLPRVNGSALVELFRDRPALQNIPVVLLSSSQAPQDLARADELRRGIYFVKPSDLESFMDIGRRVKEFWAASLNCSASSQGA